MEIREVARQIIEKELKAVKNVSSKLGDEIEAAVKAMHECKGRIVISGLGKSGTYRQKARRYLGQHRHAVFLCACC